MKNYKKTKTYIIGFKKSILFFLFLLISFGGISQGFPDNPTQIKEIPPSPTMWEFQKYGDYPVSMHTGVPEISIPITTAQSGSLQVPISINYHASGIKVDQMASWVGLGWELNAGGAITRTIRGTQDEGNRGYINFPYKIQGSFDPAYSDNYYLTEEMIQGFVDTEPDIFYYRFLGYSGKFLFNHATTRTSATIALIPHNDLKIIPTFSGATITAFIIVTPEGITAEFAYPESTSEYRKAGLLGSLTVTANSTWHLKSLTAPNAIDQITFEYGLVPGNGASAGFVSEQGITSESESINYFDPCLPNQYSVGTDSYNPGITYYGVKRLKKINFNNGYILFNSSTGSRLDDPDNESLRLDAIQTYSITGQTSNLIKSYELNYNYFGAYAASFAKPEYTVRLKLDKVFEKGKNGISNNPHQFFYKASPVISPPFPYRFSRSQDYWGYYNGKSNTSLAPQIQVEVTTGSYLYIGDANRSVDPTYAQVGVLNKIIYPTQGYSNFEYESNKATVGTDTQQFTGGLRIKTITNYSEENTIPVVKSYEYTQQQNQALSSGVYNGASYINPQDFKYGTTYHFNAYQAGSCQTSNTYQHFTTRTLGVGSSPISTRHISSVFYSQVKEYFGSNTQFNGFKWYHYSIQKDDSFQGTGPVSFLIDRSWDRGQLLLEETFENGKTIPVKKVTNEYETILVQQPISGFKPVTRFDVQSIGFLPAGSTQSAYSFRSNQYLLVYYEETVPWKRLKNSTKTEDGMVSIENFIYDDLQKHINVIKKSSNLSNGKLIETKYYFPENITSTSSMAEGGVLTSNELSQINNLKKLNPSTGLPGTRQINVPVQTVTVVDGGIKSIERTLYNTFDGIVLPSSIRAAKGNAIVDERIVFSNYINGRLQEVSLKDGSKTSYIWGYKDEYPIAKIINLPHSSIPATTISDLKTKSDADYSVSTENTLRSALNTFRNTFPEAMITTYTYDPLVGVTSTTDPSGYTTFYTYDGFDQLQLVKNKNGEVLEKYKYHYAYEEIIASTTSTVSSLASGGTVGFTTTASGGSGNFTYKWTVSNANLNQTSTTTTGNFSVLTSSSHSPSFTLTCEIRDTVTNEVVTTTKQITINTSYPSLAVGPMLISPSGAKNVGYNVTYGVTVKGGSGNYSYVWTKTNPQQTILIRNGASSISDIITSQDCNFFTMKCVVKDNVTGNTITSSTSITISSGCSGTSIQ